jgi:hypothetical protein
VILFPLNIIFSYFCRIKFNKTITNQKNKIMKNLRIALLVVLAAAFVLPACKKGENDPFMSLHSRKARVVGSWNLTTGSITQNGSTIVYPQANYTRTMEFKGDNSYTITEIDAGVTTTEKGSWAFSSKSKGVDLKNKEALVLYATSYSSGSNTNTYTGYYALASPTILLLDRLANKEMVVKFDGNESGGGSSYTISGTMTYEQ